jgi:geranyl-CoA carboxylase alpha subunit
MGAIIMSNVDREYTRRFNTVLIANRGEIAVRVIRTARRLGYVTVAVYSEVDENAFHVKLADKAVAIGGRSPADSYLSIQKILHACTVSGADAVHPGYGFLSENAEFARACAGAGITFIGPSARAIHLMGNKSCSKHLMEIADVPCIPGYHGEEQSLEFLYSKGLEVGFPLMIKAAAGGGGRGLRIASKSEELTPLLELARNEGQRSFGSGELLLERALFGARHVEVQVFGDNYGTVVYLGERDCSIQRRHQKVFEESPSPAVDEVLRAKMGEATVKAARAIEYCGAGTVEFLLDQNGDFYFLEMNTRLQVEHPVTEMVTGLDLVEWQLRVAAGEPLPFKQEEIKLQGHSIEARLYAEDPSQNFVPQVGEIHFWKPASSDFARTDHGLNSSDNVSPYYDAMLAKVIAHGPDRETSCRLLRRALCDTAILGIKTNREFLINCLDEDDFVRGKAATDFIEKTWLRHADARTVESELFFIAAAVFVGLNRHGDEELSGWSSSNHMTSFLRLATNGGKPEYVEVNFVDQNSWRIRSGDVERTIRVRTMEGNSVSFQVGELRSQAYFAMKDNTVFLSCGEHSISVTDTLFDPPVQEEAKQQSNVTSPANGLLTAVEVTEGEFVKRYQPVCHVESMKLIQPVVASMDGIVRAVHAFAGQQVKVGELLVELDPVESSVSTEDAVSPAVV